MDDPVEITSPLGRKQKPGAQRPRLKVKPKSAGVYPETV